MKTIKFITPEYVPLKSRWYLTYGKWYEAKSLFLGETCDHLFDDTGIITAINPPSCPHLNGHRWLIKDDEPTPQVTQYPWRWYRLQELARLWNSWPEAVQVELKDFPTGKRFF